MEVVVLSGNSPLFGSSDGNGSGNGGEDEEDTA